MNNIVIFSSIIPTRTSVCASNRYNTSATKILENNNKTQKRILWILIRSYVKNQHSKIEIKKLWYMYLPEIKRDNYEPDSYIVIPRLSPQATQN